KSGRDYHAVNFDVVSSGVVRCPPRALMRETAKYQRRIGSAEAERIGEYYVDISLPRVMGHEINRCLHRRIVEIDGRRSYTVAHGENREDGLDRAGGAQKMTDRGFGRGHADTGSGIADQAMHRAKLDLVAQRCRGAVGIDVVDLDRWDAGTLDRRIHAA